MDPRGSARAGARAGSRLRRGLGRRHRPRARLRPVPRRDARLPARPAARAGGDRRRRRRLAANRWRCIPPMRLAAGSCVAAARGTAAARASGLRAGDAVCLVALCDADDVWVPGKLAAQLAAFERLPDAALAFGRRRRRLRRPADRRALEGVPAGVHGGRAAPDRSSTSATRSHLERRDAHGGRSLGPAASTRRSVWPRTGTSGFGCRARRHVRLGSRRGVRYRRHPGGLTADVAALARCQLELHRAHGALVSPEVRERALEADAAALRSATRGGLRALLPRRDPYRR